MESLVKIPSLNCIFKTMLCLVLLVSTSQSDAVDWSKVSGKEVILMYPGQTSLQWLQSSSLHKGAAMVEKGKSCRLCHRDQEVEIGQSIFSDKELDANPAKGMPSSMPIMVKTAHDSEDLSVQFQWLASDKQIFSISVMLDNSGAPLFKSAGCWLACHSDSQEMSQAVAGKENSKYLLAARDKKDAVIFTEYWQANIRQNAAPQVLDGYVSDKRHVNKSPLVKADAKYQDGKWTVTLKRKLLSNEPNRKSFVAGEKFYFGIALHVGLHGGRYHLASFEQSLALDKGRADFVAINQSTKQSTGGVKK